MRPEKNKKQAKKINKKVKATLSTTEEKVAEHHRICLLRSFPAKRSKTSSPAEQLRKGLVNNIKPYAVYLFIHFLLISFYEHTHGDVLSTGPIISVPDGEELKVRVRAICSRFQRPLMSCDWLYHQCRWASNRYWRKARRKVSTSTWLSLFAQLLTTLTSKLTQATVVFLLRPLCNSGI